MRISLFHRVENTEKILWKKVSWIFSLSPFKTTVGSVANVDRDQAAQKCAVLSRIYTVHLVKHCRPKQPLMCDYLDHISLTKVCDIFGAPKFMVVGWLYWGFDATLTAKVISWRSVTHVFPGFLTPVLTQLFFPKPLTAFLTCFCRGEKRKYAGKESHLNRGSNSQPPGLESD